MPQPLLEMQGISKSFGGNLVLSDVDLSLEPREVHALVGENGAGKSTLMKILNGVHSRDSGAIRMAGSELHIATPYDARRAGISMIFQEHTLAPHLTVGENILLGMEPGPFPGMLSRRTLEERARQVLGSCSFPLSPSVRVARLTRAEKQWVEIARALTIATRVVVMDEPTAMLTRKESEELFRIVGNLRERGLAVVYISHRLEELPTIADRITILRDGRRVFSGSFASIDMGGIIGHMVGREIRELYPARVSPQPEIILEVRGLGDGHRYRNVTFGLHRGEVLGIAGLVGAGRTALARGIFGLEPPSEGGIWLHGERVRLRSSRQAISAGIGYLTEDRKATSVFPHLSLAHNISIAALERVRAGPVLDLAEEARRCRRLVQQLGIRARSEREPMYRLSGGNQQKALFARWLFAGSKVLLLDEPTQGVDLGARAEIYRLIREIAAQGGAVVLISSDLPELLGMSHRIAVMRRGEMVAILPGDRTDQEEIMRFAALERADT